MSILNYILKNILFFLSWVTILGFLSSCGSSGKFWDPADAKKVHPNVNERVKKNLEEGRGWSVNKALRKVKEVEELINSPALIHCGEPHWKYLIFCL